MSSASEGHAGGGGPSAPAGWYPVDGGIQRYWDGMRWTEHLAPASDSGSPPAPQPGPSAGDAPAPWVGGGPAGQPQPAQPFAGQAPDQSQPFAVNPQGPTWGPASPAPPLAGGPVGGPVGAVTADDRSMALLLHLLTLVAGFVGPLIVWLVKREQSPFIDYHGKEALNFQFSMFLYWIGALFALIILIGFLLIPVLLVLQILFPIMAGIAANRGEYYRYPMTIRFIK